jgi:hypothetical protein
MDRLFSDKREKKTGVGLDDIFRMHSDAYCAENVLTPELYTVINAIKNCRTFVLGGHVAQCNHCNGLHYTYHSCRNRHCPKCESFKAAQWLEERQNELLPVPYFHVVFTLPHELNTLVLYNKKTLYDLLFQSAWLTIKTLGNDKKRLGGEMGMLSILHTWGQNLSQHNHVHCIVPGGALTLSGKWVGSKKYLFPVKVMSKIFRGIYVSALRAADESNKLTLPEKIANNAKGFNQLLDSIMKKEWVVYAKAPFAGPEKLLHYLGRYTHKIAISNYRILACDAESVTFKWRDYADGNKEKIMRLKPDEFIRRFLSHVLPRGFMRIRGFGFLANACKKKKTSLIQRLLSHQPAIQKEKRDTKTRMMELTGRDISICPTCQKGTLENIGEIPRRLGKLLFDTS